MARAKKKTKEEPKDEQTKAEAIAKVRAAINSRFEFDIILSADKSPVPSTIRVPTGIMQLDLDLGGGFPAGGLCVIEGKDQSGKSELVYYTIAMLQRIYGQDASVLICSSEGPLDIDRMRSVGVQVALPTRVVEDRNRARVLAGKPPLTPEEIGKTVGTLESIEASLGEHVLESVLMAIGSNCFHLIAIDSVTTLMPGSNVGKGLLEEDKRAAHASMITRFLYRLALQTKRIKGGCYTSLLCTQQMRANQDRANAPSFKQQYIPTTAGNSAWALRHQAAIRVNLSSGSKIKKQITGEKVVIGKGFKWAISKGKFGTHDNKEGEDIFYYGDFTGVTGVDRQASVVTAGMVHGVLAETDEGVFVTGTGEQIASTMDELVEKLRTDWEIEHYVRRTILSSKGLDCLYRRED